MDSLSYLPFDVPFVAITRVFYTPGRARPNMRNLIGKLNLIGLHISPKTLVKVLRIWGKPDFLKVQMKGLSLESAIWQMQLILRFTERCLRNTRIRKTDRTLEET